MTVKIHISLGFRTNRYFRYSVCIVFLSIISFIILFIYLLIENCFPLTSSTASVSLLFSQGYVMSSAQNESGHSFHLNSAFDSTLESFFFICIYFYLNTKHHKEADIQFAKTERTVISGMLGMVTIVSHDVWIISRK